jgi:F-type H+-transporting ATPase subunit beta
MQGHGHAVMNHLGASERTGSVASIRGSVVDVHFPDGLPAVNHALKAGAEGRVIIEVVAHQSADTVRGIALTPTQGLFRGAPVLDTGESLQVPVGRRLLGRMLNVFGAPIDGGQPFEGGEWRSIHQAPLPLARRSAKMEMFETGIKAIDLLSPLERGGKAGMFGGAGVGKTVVIAELIRNMAGRYQGVSMILIFANPFWDHFAAKLGG